MSKFKIIRSKMRSRPLLVKALEGLGYVVEDHDEPQALRGYLGDVRGDKAHVIVRRNQISAYANDLGFYQNEDGTISTIVSDWDSLSTAKGRGSYIVEQLKQAFAAEELKVKARKQGLTLETSMNDQGVLVFQYVGTH